MIARWWARVVWWWFWRGVRIERLETACRYVGPTREDIPPGALLTILDLTDTIALVERRLGTGGFVFSAVPLRVPRRSIRPAPDAAPTGGVPDRLFRRPLDRSRADGAG